VHNFVTANNDKTANSTVLCPRVESSNKLVSSACLFHTAKIRHNRGAHKPQTQFVVKANKNTLLNCVI